MTLDIPALRKAAEEATVANLADWVYSPSSMRPAISARVGPQHSITLFYVDLWNGDANMLRHIAAWNPSTALVVLAELTRLEEENKRLREGLHEIEVWANAYPANIFIEPDWKLAQAGLASVGITLDAVSGSNMRHVVDGVGKIVRALLSDPKEQ